MKKKIFISGIIGTIGIFVALTTLERSEVSDGYSWKDRMILSGSSVSAAILNNLSGSQKVQIIVENNEATCIFNGTANDPIAEMTNKGPCSINESDEWESKVTLLDNGTTRVSLTLTEGSIANFRKSEK
ncbi:hypothetical protein ACPV3A_29620 [Paenibacillus sp. Dod16]|uniref:hypothetical protein n=1 Tax=Paenibacillus sp. Dod16 TaxID=3416392 RepID=UPI003CE7455E